MSVMQLLFLRCNASGSWLYYVATNTNSISTISRHVLPTVSATKFTSWEKNSNSFIRTPRLQETKNCFSKDELLIEKHDKWKYYKKSLSSPMIEPVCPSSQTTEKRTIITVKDDWVPISHGLFYNTSTSHKECYPTTDRANHANKVTCSSEKKSVENSKESSNKGLPSEDTLETAAAILTRELVAIFVKKPDYLIYRRDIVLENRISNKVLLREYGHYWGMYIYIALYLKYRCFYLFNHTFALGFDGWNKLYTANRPNKNLCTPSFCLCATTIKIG